MATYNANYSLVQMTSGTYDVDTLGDGITATTVHQIYCSAPGTLTMVARGGGQATLSMASGQSIDCLVKKVIVSSGTFIGFRSKLESRGH